MRKVRDRLFVTVFLIFVTCTWGCNDNSNSDNDAGTENVPDDAGNGVPDSGSDPETEDDAGDEDDAGIDEEHRDRIDFELSGTIGVWGSTIPAEGWLEITIDGESYRVEDEMFTYLHSYSTEYDFLTGWNSVDLRAHKEQEMIAENIAVTKQVTINMNKESLLQMIEDGENSLVSKKHQIFAKTRNKTLFFRRDGKLLWRDCFSSVMDASNDESFINLEIADDAVFDQGNDIVTSGTIFLSTAPEEVSGLTGNMTDYEGVMCLFYIDGERTTRENYEVMLEDKVIDCDIPEDIKTPTAESYAAFEFQGEINDNATFEQGIPPVFGSSAVELTLDGVEYSVGDGESYVVYIPVGNEFEASEGVWIYTYGAYETIGENHTKVYRLVQNFSSDVKDSIDSDEKVIEPGSLMIATLMSIENKTVGLDQYAKLEFHAAIDSESADTKLFFCNADDSIFAVGESLEIAGKVSLTSNTDVIRQFLEHEGIEHEGDVMVSCLKNSEIISCDEF